MSSPCKARWRMCLRGIRHAFYPAVLRTPPFFRLILTISYCLYDFLREQELGTGRSPITDKAISFHGQIKWAKLNVFAPDSQDAMELWALRPHVNFVKVICVYELHVFFHQYVADLRDERSENVVLLMSALRDSQPEGENYVLQSAIQTGKSENIFRTVSTSPLVFNMTVIRRSGAIRLSPDVPVGQLQPLTTMVSCTDAGSMVTPFVVPLPPDIEQPCRQLQDFLTCRTQESCQPSLWCSLSASSSARTLPWKLPQFSSSSFSISSLYAESRHVRRVTPCCRRRRMTVCFQVWILQSLSAVVNRFRGQNTLLLCLHVRRSGLCCQMDPPVLQTGSVVRISMTMPEGSLTSASVTASSDHSVLTTLLSEGLGGTKPVLHVMHR